MEFPEDQRGESRSSDAHSPRQDAEAEAWLRGELAFLYSVERRIVRRTRLRQEAWRAAAVALILAVFACCWYLAALSSDGSGPAACPAKTTTAAAGSAKAGTALHTGTGTVDATASGCSA